MVQAECTLKESAAINQILGRRVSLLSLLSRRIFTRQHGKDPRFLYLPQHTYTDLGIIYNI